MVLRPTAWLCRTPIEESGRPGKCQVVGTAPAQPLIVGCYPFSFFKSSQQIRGAVRHVYATRLPAPQCKHWRDNFGGGLIESDPILMNWVNGLCLCNLGWDPTCTSSGPCGTLVLVYLSLLVTTIRIIGMHDQVLFVARMQIVVLVGADAARRASHPQLQLCGFGTLQQVYSVSTDTEKRAAVLWSRQSQHAGVRARRRNNEWRLLFVNVPRKCLQFLMKWIKISWSIKIWYAVTWEHV